LGLQSVDDLLNTAVIDFNENRSLNGSQQPSLLDDTAQAVLNRMDQGLPIGPPHGTASPNSPGIPDPEVPVAQACLIATEQASFERKLGIDTTNGSTLYYQQGPSMDPPSYAGDPRYTLQTTDGPMNNSDPNPQVPDSTGIVVKFFTGP
jgi:hypothetical protein